MASTANTDPQPPESARSNRASAEVALVSAIAASDRNRARPIDAASNVAAARASTCGEGDAASASGALRNVAAVGARATNEQSRATASASGALRNVASAAAAALGERGSAGASGRRSDVAAAGEGAPRAGTGDAAATSTRGSAAQPAVPGTAGSFVVARWIFFRLLGLVLLSAFTSIWSQIDGLLGSRGILPIAPWLASVREALGDGTVTRWLQVPTLFWLGDSDAALHLACAAGTLAALLVTAGIATRASLIASWAIYLSICTIGRTFLAYQWDILLLEVTFTAIFFAPSTLTPKNELAKPPNVLALMLLRLLLFKLVFSSGVVKLTSGDPTWRNFTALDYHYETQPLPTWLGWYAHQLPASVQHFSVMATFFIQLIVPFAIFLPRRIRAVACAFLVFEQLLIALTGNYCYFNLLALALCILLLDDPLLIRGLPRRLTGKLLQLAGSQPASAEPKRDRFHKIRHPAMVTIAAIFILFQSLILTRTVARGSLSSLGSELLQAISPFRTISGYGLFAVMTTKRNEIIIEGSDDGLTWKAYALPYQPGDVDRRPEFVAPHQPRVDWQMWFAALGTLRQNGWFVAFTRRLLEGEPAVRGLLEHDPFPDKPPKYIRAELWEYHFTDFDERAKTGAWWRRTHAGTYMPARSL